MVASFHCCGTSPPFHTLTRMAWKRSRTMDSAGSSILSSSTRRESGPGPFQLCIPRTARLVSSSVRADPAGTESPVVGATGRYCTSSMMAGFSVGDLLLGRVLKNLAHRWRISPLSFSKTPFPSLAYCCLPRLPPAKAHRFLEVFVQASHVAFLVHRFKPRRISL